MEALPGHRLAYEFGSAADSEARQWERRIEAFEKRPYELPQYALDAVRLDEADAALVSATDARLYLRDHPAWNAQYTYVTDVLYAAAVRQDRYQTWAAINRALQSLADDGTLDAILQKWL